MQRDSARVPNDKLKDMDATVLKVLMALLTIEDADFANADRFSPNRDHAASGAWSQEEGDAQHSEEATRTKPAGRPWSSTRPCGLQSGRDDGEKLAEEWKKGTSGEAKMCKSGASRSSSSK